jgi:lysylphosphatidylglycerol synthetase-like protein (DUF2156 family)
LTSLVARRTTALVPIADLAARLAVFAGLALAALSFKLWRDTDPLWWAAIVAALLVVALASALSHRAGRRV